MLRFAGMVDLVVSCLLVTCVGAAVATGCGGRPPVSAGSGAGDGSRDASAGDGAAEVSIPGVTGLVASNGVPIPDPPLKDQCGALGVAVTSCGPLDDCPSLTCDCGGVAQKIEVPQSCASSRHCLVQVSCGAVCASADLGASALPTCVLAGPCKSNADCTDPAKSRCLLASADTSGYCVSGQGGSACYRDSDCASSACVAIPGGSRSCQDVNDVAICNRNDQCSAPTAGGLGMSICVLQDGQFFGPCTDGTEHAPCVASDDCAPGDGCAQLLAGSIGQCTSHGQGAPCAADGDCAQHRCVGDPDTWGVCDTGELGTRCERPSDCLSGFCGGAVCTTGAKGAPCVSDADCATHSCASPGGGAALVGQCTDGTQGSACWVSNVAQCQAGLVCQSFGGVGTCVVAGSVGAPCQQDADCLAQKCAAPVLPVPGLAVCTEGKRGQRCHDGSQCDAGLHCLSDGELGVCVDGAPGDPCQVAGDCASGTCLGTNGATASCAGVPEHGRCGAGSCVAGVCWPTCM